MALGLSLSIASPVPPPKKAEAQSHKAQIVATPTVTPQPQTVAQPETPQVPPEATTAPADAPSPPTPPPAPQYGCGDDPNMAYIYQHESGCSTTAVNAGSGAYGLCQALPGYKMASAGGDWQYSWSTQNAWCVSYALERYGTTYNAYLFWVNNHWW